MEQASGANIYIGTSGWSYPTGEGTWRGYFYPPGEKRELAYYSQFFNTVEINSSFYRPPRPEFVANWARQVPEGFLFTAKLWQKFTHPKMYAETSGGDGAISAADVDRFRRSLEPLAARGRLGALLAQFPPSFRNDPYGQDILAAVIRTFGQYHLAVELRHRSWSDDPATAARMADAGVPGWPMPAWPGCILMSLNSVLRWRPIYRRPLPWPIFVFMGAMPVTGGGGTARRATATTIPRRR